MFGKNRDPNSSVDGRFKRQATQPEDCHGQNSDGSSYDRRGICNNLIYRFGISQYFRNKTGFCKYYNNFITYCNHHYRSFLFFIQHSITNRDIIRNKRHDHFKKITDILQKWVETPTNASASRRDCNHSFMDLYVNAFDTLKSNNRFQRIKSHLKNEDYKEAKDLLSGIETRSTPHNKSVSDFMRGFEGLIFAKVFTKDPSVGIVNDFEEYTDPKLEHGYSLNNIRSHYAKEASGNHSDLTIDQEIEAGKTKFQIHRMDVGVNVAPLVLSTDQKQIDSIRKRMEDERMKPAIVEPLKGFLNEANEIVELYNDKFIPEIQNIITEIEDEGEMKGGCGLSYCPKN